MALRTLSNALPDSNDSVVLLQKSGVFSKFTKASNELYEVRNCIDIKEHINRCHIFKQMQM